MKDKYLEILIKAYHSLNLLKMKFTVCFEIEKKFN